MNGTELVSLFISFSNKFTPIGLTVILQSTIIITGGLIVLYILRKSNPSLQSIVLRVTLIAIILTPLVSVLYIHFKVNYIQVLLPIETEMIKQQQSIRVNDESDKTGKIDSGNFRSNDMISQKSINSKTLEEKEYVLPHSQTFPQNINIHNSEIRNKLSRYSQANSNPDVISNAKPKDRGVLPIRFPGTTMEIHTFLYFVFTTTWIISSIYYLIKSIIVSLCIVYIRRTGYRAKMKYQNMCKDAASILGVKVPPILQHPVVRGTFVCGFFKPAIVLPYQSREQVIATREVLLHELVHLARQDNLWNLVCQIALILLPVQPLISIFMKKISEVNDYACDDYVLAFGGNKRSFAIQLFNIAKTYHPGIPEATIGTGIISSTSPISDRIERILDTSYIRIIKVKAFEILSVVIFSFFSLTLSGFVGFKGNPANFGKQLFQPENHHIERIISHVPINMQYQNTMHVDAPNKTGIKKEKDKGIPQNEEKPNETLTIDHLEEKRDEIIQTEFADSGKISTNEENYSTTVKPQQHQYSESENEITHAINDELTVTDAATPSDMPQADVKADAVVTDSLLMNSFTMGASRFQTASPDIIENAVLKVVEVAISYDFENADLTDPEQRKLSDMFQSLQQNKMYPVWSPDGEHIAFSDRNYGLWMVSSSGGEPVLAFDNYYKVEYNGYVLQLGGIEPLGFTPDGLEITFLRFVIDEELGTKVIVDDRGSQVQITVNNPIPIIESVNIETGESRTIARNATWGRWSYDGRYFTHSRINTESFLELVITDTLTGKDILLEEFLALPIYFPVQDSYLMFNKHNLFMKNDKSGILEELEIDDMSEVSDISRDGKWILYIDASDEHKSVLYNTETGSNYEVFPESSIHPSWAKFSPDGRKLSFCLKTGMEGDQEWEIYVYDLELMPESPVEVIDVVPALFELTGNFPNPFNPTTTINFSLDRSGFATLVIYNIMGQSVRELIAGQMNAGIHIVNWDGRDDSGNTVSSGVYISCLNMGKQVAAKRMMLMK